MTRIQDIKGIEQLLLLLPERIASPLSINSLRDDLQVNHKTVSNWLEALKKIGKRQAKKILGQMEGVSNFAVNYCMLTSLGGHAIPLTARMTEYLRSNELVHPEADEQEIEGFLARQITAANGYEFYALLRGHSESDGRKSKKKARTKSVPKTTKKKASQTRKKTGTKKSKK